MRVLIDTVCHEHEIAVHWEETGAVPLVWADRYGLMQVFLNLAKNSIRAMESVARQTSHDQRDRVRRAGHHTL